MKIDYTQEVSAPMGVDRSNEDVTITSWNDDTEEKKPTRIGLVQGRIHEVLLKIDDPNRRTNDGTTFYIPTLFLDIKNVGQTGEVPVTPCIFVSESDNSENMISLRKRFAGAFSEWKSYRGMIYVSGQRYDSNYKKEQENILREIPKKTAMDAIRK